MTRVWNTFNQESIPFDIISVNLGGVFKNGDKSIVVILKEGIYYITLNVNCVTPYKTALYVNKIKYFEVIAYEKDGGAFKGYERSALLKLAARDGMSLRVINTKLENEYGKAFEQPRTSFYRFLDQFVAVAFYSSKLRISGIMAIIISSTDLMLQ